MKRAQTGIILILSAIILLSCSKEKQIARRLEGMWQVDIYQKSVYGNGSPVITESGSAGNAGSFEFFSNGEGQYNIIKDLGDNMYYGDDEFLWTNTSETISIRTNSGLTKKFDVVENKTDKMIFERSQVYYFSDGEQGVSYTMDERITLVK
ncbi:MAG: hypothetical protein U9R19_10265 [Bacteroidota bacterium]|nr:hypothetical protein [Bacteroidota bacterium]